MQNEIFDLSIPLNFRPSAASLLAAGKLWKMLDEELSFIQGRGCLSSPAKL